MPSGLPEVIETEEDFERVYRERFEDFHRYAEILFNSYGSRYVSASGRAEEAVQEMFSTAWEKRDKMNEKGSPIGWMYECLFYKVKELLREDRIWTKRVMQMAADYDECDPEDFSLRLELEDSFSKMDYWLLRKLYFEGYTYAEVGAAVNMKKSALAMHVKRAKERYISDHEP